MVHGYYHYKIYHNYVFIDACHKYYNYITKAVMICEEPILVQNCHYKRKVFFSIIIK